MSDTDGRATIFVVDDEEIIRDMASEMLSCRGYEIITAGDGTEAIETFGRLSGKIDVVLLDVVMPDLNGEEVFNEMQKIKPGIRVILSSGYSADNISDELVESSYTDFIEKPYTLKDLLEKIDAVL